MAIVPLHREAAAGTGRAPDGREGTIDAATGGLWLAEADGSARLIGKEEWQPSKRKSKASKWFANLVDVLDAAEVARLGDEVHRGVSADHDTRTEWMEMTAEAIRMLGLRIDAPRGEGAGSGAPLEGMSTVRHPLLLEACLGFQSDFRGEMLPAEGPVKVRTDSVGESGLPAELATQIVQALVGSGAIAPEMAEQAMALVAGLGHNGGPPLNDVEDQLAMDLEKDFNHYLTVTASEYYPDTDRAAFVNGLMGCTFKKVFHDPLRRRPVSEAISPKDLIVDAGVTDLANAPRVTHEITMLPHELLQLQEAGVYAKGVLGQPMQEADAVTQAVSEAQGFKAEGRRPEDRAHTLWECYCRANVRGLDEEDDDAEVRVPRPYVVTIDKDSRKVFAIRRNWNERDVEKAPRRVFVKYPFVPALGFYDIGLMHILGNATMALTAGWRLALDAAFFGNFPGFLYADVLGKQLTNVFRVPPGGGVPIQTGGRPIGDMIQRLPYPGLQPALLELVDNIAQTAGRVGTKPNVPTGEGQKDVPVGTVLATILESTKLVGAVFKRQHGAQAEEFGLFKERFREDPEAFWRHNLKPARAWEKAEFLAALEDYDLVPAADPNTPSRLHRAMTGLALFQMALQAPQVFRVVETAQRVLRLIGVVDPDAVLKTQAEYDAEQQAMAQAGQGGKPVDPSVGQAAAARAQAATMTAQARLAESQAKGPLLAAQTQKTQAEGAAVGTDMQVRAQAAVTESADRAADRQAKTAIDLTREETERLRLAHEQAADHADRLTAAMQPAEPGKA